jgi:uncharacterized repeat protein (TIGR03803 family)
MEIFRFRSRALGMCAMAALSAGCAAPHSTMGIPVTTVPAAGPGIASARSHERVLYSFTGGNDGGNAATAVSFDGQGNLYGTTVIGGSYSCGTVFKLKPQPSPPWQEGVLYNFSCYGDGKNPHGGVSFDPQGNLDGTTVAGGSGGYCTGDGCGVVFQLKGTTESVLHSFTAGDDGFGPGGGVVFDTAGNLYGTTPDGGNDSLGTVYQISRNGRQRHETVIHTFTGGKDGGVGSLGSLLLDGSGTLFGVTEIGGAHAAGTVFKLSPASKKMTTLYAFKGTPDAASPYGGLIADASGNLYGTTYYGGANGLGSVYELVRNAMGGYRERLLYSFRGGSDGSSSTSTLVLAGSGDLYGTTSAGGGTCDCGTIFKVNAKSGKETVLHSFGNGTDGAYSYYGLTADASGNFYGTTVAGGRFNQGAVFEFTP